MHKLVLASNEWQAVILRPVSRIIKYIVINVFVIMCGLDARN